MCDMTDVVQLSQPTVSYHLKILADADTDGGTSPANAKPARGRTASTPTPWTRSAPF